MKYLSLKALLELHRDQIRKYGGESGVRDAGVLESAHQKTLQSAEGKPLHSGPIEKAAALAYGIIRNHPFVDGNKRTAAAAMILLCEINGRKFQARDDDLVEVARGVASGEIDRDELEGWLTDHTN